MDRFLPVKKRANLPIASFGGAAVLAGVCWAELSPYMAVPATLGLFTLAAGNVVRRPGLGAVTATIVTTLAMVASVTQKLDDDPPYMTDGAIQQMDNFCWQDVKSHVFRDAGRDYTAVVTSRDPHSSYDDGEVTLDVRFKYKSLITGDVMAGQRDHYTGSSDDDLPKRPLAERCKEPPAIDLPPTYE